MKDSLKTTLSLLVMVVVVAISGSLVFTKVSGSKLLSVQTGSMVPAITKGSLVVVKRVPVNQLAVGDIITFISPTKKNVTVTHRITQLPDKSNNYQFVTKGDANAISDSSISPKAIVGKVDAAIPYLGGTFDFVRRPQGLILFIYLPALLIIGDEIRKLVAYYKTQMVYIVPWRNQKRGAGKRRIIATAGMTAILLMPFFKSISVRAALQSSAVLSNSDISVVLPIPNPCTSGGNNTTIITTTGGGNVNISNSNNQNASTGNASNNSGGSATSGNATNCNSTNINVTIIP